MQTSISFLSLVFSNRCAKSSTVFNSSWIRKPISSR